LAQRMTLLKSSISLGIIAGRMVERTPRLKIAVITSPSIVHRSTGFVRVSQPEKRSPAVREEIVVPQTLIASSLIARSSAMTIAVQIGFTEFRLEHIIRTHVGTDPSPGRNRAQESSTVLR